jgi:hypothetical protein
MNSEQSHLAAAAAGAIVVTVLLTVLFLWIGTADTERWQRDAVKHGAAHYDSQTGAWQWNEPVKKGGG